MDAEEKVIVEVATQLLAAMLTNQRIYPNLSDEGMQGQREQTLVTIAVEMAHCLVKRVEGWPHSPS